MPIKISRPNELITSWLLQYIINAIIKKLVPQLYSILLVGNLTYKIPNQAKYLYFNSNPLNYYSDLLFQHYRFLSTILKDFKLAY